MPSIVLASSSPYRKQLLARLGLPFICASPNIDETPSPNENPKILAKRLAQSKAQALSTEFPQHLIIGSDQTAECDGCLLGKPGNFDNARHQLKQQSNKIVIFHAAICIYNTCDNTLINDSCMTEVQFKPLTDQDIANYLNKEQPFDCAGSFKAEGLGISLFKKLTSDDPTALIGLPLIKTVEMLEQMGVQIL